MKWNITLAVLAATLVVSSTFVGAIDVNKKEEDYEDPNWEQRLEKILGK